jgi:hypothetical protein
MRKVTVITLTVVRAAGVVQVVHGTLLWTGRAYQYFALHMAVGALVVLGLWTLAFIALSAGVSRRFAAFAVLWGVALPMFGMRQAAILVGPYHWVIRVAHLVMGCVAVALADRLAKAVVARSSRTSNPSDARSSSPVRRVS